MFGQINTNKLYSTAGLTRKQLEIRHMAVNSFEHMIRLVAPYQLMAHCHVELCKWVQKEYTENTLVLWPRDHGKSRYSAFYAVWEIVRNPAICIIYASATAEKAEEQLRFIKSVLDSKIMARYFPELILPEEGRREAWNSTYIIVDHPLRSAEGVVDSTIMTCGIGKTITGKHCHRLILDDLVVPENNTETGRRDTNSWAAQAASIISSEDGACIFAVGTRYHPQDAYQIMIETTYPIVNREGEVLSEETLYKVIQADVEEDGEFLWPRQQRKDGKWFGFNRQILEKKKATYVANGEIIQFYAQYYNDPNDKSTSPISRDLFKYYTKESREFSNGVWTVENQPLYVYAAVDLAATTGDKSDYTVIIVGAIDDLGNRYVMDMERIKTTKISDIHNKIKGLYQKYMFKKLRIEAVAGFKLVAQDLADRLFEMGIRIPVDFYLAPNNEQKAVRINNILEPLYQSGSVYHYRGGHCQVLEDELVSANPAHDDAKDAWAMCCDLMQRPLRKRKRHTNVLTFNSKFGGVAA